MPTLVVEAGWHQRPLMAAAAGNALPAAFLQSWYNPGRQQLCDLPDGPLELDLAWQLLDQGTFIVGVRAQRNGQPQTVSDVRLAGDPLTLDAAGDPPEWVIELGEDFAAVSSRLDAGLTLEVLLAGEPVCLAVA